MSDRQRDGEEIKKIFFKRKYFPWLNSGGESKNYQFNIEIFPDRPGGQRQLSKQLLLKNHFL